MLIKFELKKIFYNRFFLAMLAFTLFLNLFTMYESHKTGKSVYRELQYDTYDEFVDSVQSNAEKSLSVSIFSDELSDFSKKNIEKTALDFETMRGIEIKQDVNAGVLLVLNSGISDICILLLLISIGLSLIVEEKEKRLFHLIHSTSQGTISTILSKLGALLICCTIINIIITASTVGFSFVKYGFGDVYRSIQSIPEMLSAFLRLNILQFFLMLFTIKTIGIFIVGVLIILCCLLVKRAITMLFSVILIGSVCLSMTFIPETSKFNFFKYINPYSLLNPYRIFSSYINLNIFGKPVNVINVFFAFLIAMACLSVVPVIVYFIKKRPLENSDKRNKTVFFHSRVRNSIIHFELKKILSLNKAIVILLIFTLLQTYNVYKQENFQSSDDYYYKYYMEMLNGSLTDSKETFLLSEKAKIDEAEKQIYILNEQRQNNELSLQEYIQKQEQYSEIINKADMFNRVYEKYLYIKSNPRAEFIYDLGYEKMFGISEPKFSLNNSLLLLCAFVLCFCSIYFVDYKNAMYKILGTTKYGIDKTRKMKSLILSGMTALICLIAYVPEIIYIGRFYGFHDITARCISIPELAAFKSLPIWLSIILLYLLRFTVILAITPIISAVSLRSRNNIITALICLILFVLPIATYSATDIKILSDISLWDLLSGQILINKSSAWLYVIKIIILLFASLVGYFYVRKHFGKTVAKAT